MNESGDGNFSLLIGSLVQISKIKSVQICVSSVFFHLSLSFSTKSKTPRKCKTMSGSVDCHMLVYYLHSKEEFNSGVGLPVKLNCKLKKFDHYLYEKSDYHEVNIRVLCKVRINNLC